MRKENHCSFIRLSLHDWFLSVLLFLLLSCITFTICSIDVYANDQKVADQSGLLSEQEEEKLQKRLMDLSEKYELDVIVATTDTFEGKGRWGYTDEFYFGHDYGYGDTDDGIILMVNLREREYQYLTGGKAIDIFTDYGLEIIDRQVTSYLSDGEYYDAFVTYAELAEAFVKEAVKDAPYDVNHTYKQKMSAGARLGISFGVGAVLALFTVLILFGQLKTVRVKGQAQDYVRKGSFRVTGSHDLYLYRTVTKRRIEKDDNGGGGSSTRSSSGGGRAGGRGGSF